MQETHLRPAKYNDIKKQWHGEVYISPDTTFWDGILLLANGFAPEIDILKMSTKGRFIIFGVSNISSAVVALRHTKRETKVKTKLFPKTKKTNRITNHQKRQYYFNSRLP